MAIRIKVDVLTLLREAGYSSYRLRKEKILNDRVIQKFRSGDLPSWHELDVICNLLGLQIGDIVEHVPDQHLENRGS